MLRLALIQERAAFNDPDANLAAGIDACRRARAVGADLVVFPELWQIGYAPCPDGPHRDAWLARAEPLDGRWVGAFRELAATAGIAVAVTFLRRTDAGPANATAVIGSDGALALVHDKVHVCDFTWEAVLRPGARFRAAPVRTRAGPVRIGVMTCFDREFPESARSLALDGAELILSPNACLICDDRLGQFRARAFENMLAVAMANYPRPFMNGRSAVFDGIASAADRPRDHQILVAGARPGLLVADVDLDALRRYRAQGLWTHARRRPDAYRNLARNPSHAPERR
ncbi:carbon-nitrogen hydrolase family protein [Dactylosporangium sp. NPDC000244]|uniref:carbon-nitrogen hydrolase family protein n=1 Tax=Dactylosporangium sp. NPDC000244 TaxID=3154365 RepID=UPI00331B27A4